MTPRVGLDLWEVGFQQLREGSRRGMFNKLLVGASIDRRRRVLEWAEDHVWLEGDEHGPAILATGRSDPLFKPSRLGELGPLVRAMGDGDVYSARLVVPFLKAPDRTWARFAFEALSSHPRSKWGPDVTALVERLAESSDELTLQAARALLSR